MRKFSLRRQFGALTQYQVNSCKPKHENNIATLFIFNFHHGYQEDKQRKLFVANFPATINFHLRMSFQVENFYFLVFNAVDG